MSAEIIPLNGEIVSPSHDVDRLSNGDRLVFAEVLSCMLGPEVRPTVGNLSEWANKYPDRYFYSVKLMAGLVGYSEKVELSGSLQAEISKMPDQKLLSRLAELEKQLGPKASGTETPAPGNDSQEAGK